MKFLRSKIEKVLQTDLCMNLRNSHESAVQRERMIESKRRDLQDFLQNDRLSQLRAASDARVERLRQVENRSTINPPKGPDSVLFKVNTRSDYDEAHVPSIEHLPVTADSNNTRSTYIKSDLENSEEVRIFKRSLDARLVNEERHLQILDKEYRKKLDNLKDSESYKNVGIDICNRSTEEQRRSQLLQQAKEVHLTQLQQISTKVRLAENAKQEVDAEKLSQLEEIKRTEESTILKKNTHIKKAEEARNDYRTAIEEKRQRKIQAQVDERRKEAEDATYQQMQLERETQSVAAQKDLQRMRRNRADQLSVTFANVADREALGAERLDQVYRNRYNRRFEEEMLSNERKRINQQNELKAWYHEKLGIKPSFS